METLLEYSQRAEGIYQEHIENGFIDLETKYILILEDGYVWLNGPYLVKAGNIFKCEWKNERAIITYMN